jgi:ubiquinone/menaquinone biosynthesis C-methylase UbiE
MKLQVMFVEPIPTVSKACSEGSVPSLETEELVWASLNLEGMRVIDFGVGESTKKLVRFGANVTVVDRDAGKLKKYDDLGIPSLNCDMTSFRFDDVVADVTVFCFTLHEIDPRMHRSVISTARRISPRIIVVEPSPDGCPAYRRFARLWHEAMHSIGRFEVYQPISYWKSLIQSCGFRVTTSKKIKQKSLLPSEILDETVQNTIRDWRMQSVPTRFAGLMNEFRKYAMKNGMTWSDLIFLVGESKETSATPNMC